MKGAPGVWEGAGASRTAGTAGAKVLRPDHTGAQGLSREVSMARGKRVGEATGVGEVRGGL